MDLVLSKNRSVAGAAPESSMFMKVKDCLSRTKNYAPVPSLLKTMLEDSAQVIAANVGKSIIT